MNIFNVMKKANAGLSLTPMERAVLKAMLGALITSLTLLLPYGNDLLAGRVNIDWPHVIEMIVVGMVLAGAAKILGTLSPSDQATSAALQQAEQDANRSEVGAITNLPNIVPPPDPGGIKATFPVPLTGPGSAVPFSQPLILPGAPITAKEVIETLPTQELPVVERDQQPS